MRGRKPTPTAIKELRGNPGRRKPSVREPVPKRGAPTCPAHLSPEAKREWARVVKELDRLGLVTTIDRAALAAYCQLYARWAFAEKHLQDQGYVIETPNGMQMPSPYVSISSKALEQMKAYMVEFGMTPSARTRVNAKPDNPVKREGSLEEFNGMRLTG
ncbi:MAG: phage terminase small subunit P27 family [Phycisphaerales bacterium]|nr:MAG: phage terminase small subunit P27 family [Phycisphaerales bacterium]